MKTGSKRANSRVTATARPACSVGDRGRSRSIGLEPIRRSAARRRGAGNGGAGGLGRSRNRRRARAMWFRSVLGANDLSTPVDPSAGVFSFRSSPVVNPLHVTETRVRGDACRASPHPAPVRLAEGLRPPPGDRGPGRFLGAPRRNTRHVLWLAGSISMRFSRSSGW
jgi:hypothetical protein